MDTELLVEDRIEEGRQLLSELIRDGFDVTIALWIVRSGAGRLWHLYVASKSVEPETLGEAYRELYTCLSRIPDVEITLSDVKLIPTSHPIAKAALALRDRGAGRNAVRIRGDRQLGGLEIEEAYIYPTASSEMTLPETLKSLAARVIDNRGITTPSLLTLRDGSTVRGEIVRVDLRQPAPSQVTVLEIPGGTQRVISAEEVAKVE